MTTAVDNYSTNNTSSNPDAVAGALGTNSNISELFIKLLVAQIKNQNPLEPSDPAEFVGQLTQLSQMEALQTLSDLGKNQNASMASMQMLSLGSQVGSELTVQTERVDLAGEPLKLGFTLGSNSTQTTLVLTDSSGQERRVELGTRSAGQVATTLDPSALGLPAGNYQVRVETSSKESPAMHLTGLLTSVHLAGGNAVLQVAGAGLVSASVITAFNGRPATSSH